MIFEKRFPKGNPIVKPIGTNADGRTLYELVEDFQYVCDYLNGQVITIPKGYYTDFLSIPKWAQIIFPASEYPALLGAIVHDMLYEGEIFPRRVNDLIFKEAMTNARETTWKVEAMYKAVRIGGGATYKAHTKEKTEAIKRKFQEANPWY